MIKLWDWNKGQDITCHKVKEQVQLVNQRVMALKE